MGFFSRIKARLLERMGLVDEAKALREARIFKAADGQVYPVGPCGYVPRSAQLDPARRTNPRSFRRWRLGVRGVGRRKRAA
jgi:hypothetical protein